MIVDGYAHIGLPRFQTVEMCLANMDANGISRALVCPFETCPDLHEVHRALSIAPDRFRAFGLALGTERNTIESGLNAQFDAGFSGMRLATEHLVDNLFILDVFAARGGIPMVVGREGLANVAARLVDFLDADPGRVIVAPHMAGPTSPAIFATNGAVKALFTHPNFHVVMSRQTMLAKPVMLAWVAALIEHVGWDRMFWGSETPVLFWRDETIGDAANWLDQFIPSPTQRAATLSGNAERAIFAHPAAPAPLRLPFDPFDFELERPAPMWPMGFAADNRLPSRLVAGWMAKGGPEALPFSRYMNDVLLAATEDLDPARPAE